MPFYGDPLSVINFTSDLCIWNGTIYFWSLVYLVCLDEIGGFVWPTITNDHLEVVQPISIHILIPLPS